MHSDPHDRHHTSARPDRRRGARVCGGVRVRVGYAESRPHDGWLDWTPEARESALRTAAQEYATHEAPLASVERRHGIPRELLSRHLAHGHPLLLALPRSERLRRAAHEVGRLSHAPTPVCRRWCVPPEEVIPAATRLREATLRLLSRNSR